MQSQKVKLPARMAGLLPGKEYVCFILRPLTGCASGQFSSLKTILGMLLLPG